MPSEGERDVIALFSPSTCKLFARMTDAVGRRAGVELSGIDRLPDGGALLVANDAFGFWDVAFVAARLRQETDRPLFVPARRAGRGFIVGDLATGIGVIDGTAENADAVLRARELLLVLPGSFGPPYGFVQAAFRNHAPLVPLASLGGDGVFDLLGAPLSWRKRSARLPLPRALDFLPVPHRAHKRLPSATPSTPWVAWTSASFVAFAAKSRLASATSSKRIVPSGTRVA